MRQFRRFICLFLTVLAAAESLAVSDAANRFFQAGLRLAASGEIEPAIGQFEAAIRMEPAFADAWFNLGYVHEKRGELEPAERCMREAVRAKPKHDRAWYGMALVLIRKGDLAGAVSALEKNIALQPMSPYGFYQLGMTLHHLGRADQAQHMIDRLRQFEPKYAATLERDIRQTAPRGLAGGDSSAAQAKIEVTANPDAMRGTT